jgi:hypothetical protein
MSGQYFFNDQDKNVNDLDVDFLDPVGKSGMRNDDAVVGKLQQPSPPSLPVRTIVIIPFSRAARRALRMFLELPLVVDPEQYVSGSGPGLQQIVRKWLRIHSHSRHR